MLCLTVKGSGFFLLLLSKTSETQTFPRNLQGLEQKTEGAQGGWNTVVNNGFTGLGEQGNKEITATSALSKLDKLELLHCRQ